MTEPRFDEVVPPVLAGERLDRVVAMVADASRGEVARWIDDGLVTLGGEIVTTRSRKVVEGDRISGPRPGPVVVEDLEPDASVEVHVVHVDDDVIVVDKAPGVVVHPGAGQRAGTLVQGLLARFPEIREVGPDPDRPGIVHRIDKDTSGLLMVARTADAYDDLVEQLASRAVERRYDALVWGHLAAQAGMVEGSIGRSRRDATRMAVSATGKEARTRYEVVSAFRQPVDVSLLSCRLLTGRTHQIRVHMQSIGHSVVGDATYHGRRQSFPVPRHVLHAATLGFTHPTSGDELRFESPLPPDLAEVLSRLS